MSPLLITTANEPPPGVADLKMTDKTRRIVAAKSTLYYWALLGVKDIVIADATGSELLSAGEKASLSELGCSIEQIAYQQDNGAVQKFGKGYAEGKLIEFAVNKSEIIAKSKSFYKCTGKVVCRNFVQINRQIKEKNVTNLFWVGSYTGTILNLIDLRFFLCSTEFFKSIIFPAYMLATQGNSYVEELVTPRVTEKLKRKNFARPKLSGFCGLTNETYPETNLGDLEYSFPCYLSTEGSP
jgi:hypothetical protein